MKAAINAKGIEFDPFSFNPIELDGFNRVEFEAVAKTIGKHLTASDAAINTKVVEFDQFSFNSPEFEGIKNEAGLNRFVLSVKQWVEKTGSIGIVAKAGYPYSVVNC
jgi:hypothetical protein